MDLASKTKTIVLDLLPSLPILRIRIKYRMRRLKTFERIHTKAFTLSKILGPLSKEIPSRHGPLHRIMIWTVSCWRSTLKVVPWKPMWNSGKAQITSHKRCGSTRKTESSVLSVLLSSCPANKTLWQYEILVPTWNFHYGPRLRTVTR